MKQYPISWSPLAEESYLNTLARILEKWTIKEAEDFEAKSGKPPGETKNPQISLPAFR